MAVVVRSCCCGCSLKTGVLVIAFLSLIGGGYNIYLSFSSANEFSRGSYEGLSPPSTEHLQVVINLQKTNGAFSVFEVLTSLFLVAAYILRNRLLVLPYLVLHVILLGYNLGVVIYYVVVWKLISLIITLTISWLFSVSPHLKVMTLRVQEVHQTPIMLFKEALRRPVVKWTEYLDV
ncbi:hypothetical protein P5673_021230 [Acropora cervicornis]|uniref:Uncharacterized protein n=1 Tax=Acropora cervicornis TaxID=6130 RepID=A0AAD9Q8I0_ACRCE|nr:hypothetical protein P5673_021230 [Acropora cervicornis]